MRPPVVGFIAGLLVAAAAAAVPCYRLYQSGMDYFNDENRKWAMTTPKEIVVHTPSGLFSPPYQMEFVTLGLLLPLPVIASGGGLFAAWAASRLSESNRRATM